MAKTTAVLVALLMIGAAVADFRIHSYQHSKFWSANNRHELSLKNYGVEIEAHNLPPAQYYTQTLDHFDATNTATFQQRYYVNGTYFPSGDTANAPVFLMIQGEGALSAMDSVEGEHVELAAVYGALIVILEHRFYGYSVPTEDLSLPNLRFLSSEQAQADIVTFVGHLLKQYGLTSEANPLFIFGGSYAGAMTSWFRLKSPNLAYGAVSSSGPVQALLNFEAYNNVVHDSLSSELVGGSSQCLTLVEDAFETVASMSGSADGLQQLGSLFASCPGTDLSQPNNYYQFISNIAGNFQNAVQYNGDVRPNVGDLCSSMLAAPDPLTGLVAVNNLTLSSQGQSCVDNSWNDYIASLTNVTVNRGATGVGLRQWTYQTCAEFGYYQTCDANTNCPFAAPQINLDSFTNLCEQLFGMDAAFTQRRVEFSDLFYGAKNPGSSRVFFVNGNIDPWSSLSVTSALPNDPAVFIPGTSHCQNMDGSRANDIPALTAARAAVSKQVGEWIAEANAAYAASKLH